MVSEVFKRDPDPVHFAGEVHAFIRAMCSALLNALRGQVNKIVMLKRKVVVGEVVGKTTQEPVEANVTYSSSNPYIKRVDTNFSTIQMIYFGISSCGFLYGTIHFILGEIYGRDLFPSEQRFWITNHNEMFCLFGRWLNELYYGEWAAIDLVHHVTVFYAGYTALYDDSSCKDSAYLLTHLNCLHVPLFVWYLGCRKYCYTTNESLRALCRYIFPTLWSVSTAIRTFVGFFAGTRAYIDGVCRGGNWFPGGHNNPGGTSIFFISILLTYLDNWVWSPYFFRTLNYKVFGSIPKALKWTAINAIICVMSYYSIF
jgi:hypothetical protein